MYHIGNIFFNRISRNYIKILNVFDNRCLWELLPAYELKLFGGLK